MTILGVSQGMAIEDSLQEHLPSVNNDLEDLVDQTMRALARMAARGEGRIDPPLDEEAFVEYARDAWRAAHRA